MIKYCYWTSPGTVFCFQFVLQYLLASTVLQCWVVSQEKNPYMGKPTNIINLISEYVPIIGCTVSLPQLPTFMVIFLASAVCLVIHHFKCSCEVWCLRFCVTAFQWYGFSSHLFTGVHAGVWPVDGSWVIAVFAWAEQSMCIIILFKFLFVTVLEHFETFYFTLLLCPMKVPYFLSFSF